MRHPIQDLTGQSTFDLLVGQRPGPQFVADDPLIPKHLRLNQSAPMIPTLLFPALASFLADPSQDLIPGPRGRFGVAVLLNPGIFAQRDDRFDRLLFAADRPTPRTPLCLS